MHVGLAHVVPVVEVDVRLSVLHVHLATDAKRSAGRVDLRRSAESRSLVSLQPILHPVFCCLEFW